MKTNGKYRFSWKRTILLSYCLSFAYILFSQPIYDTCYNALDLCPQKSFNINNFNASQTSYQYGEDDFNFCFTPKRTIWCKFKTNADGGSTSIQLSGIVFTSPTSGGGVNLLLLEAGAPCDGTTYVKDTCVNNINTNSTIVIDTLKPATVYYLCFSGAEVGTITSQFSMNIAISGKAVNRPISSIFFIASKQHLCKGENITLAGYTNNCPDSSQFRWYRNGQLFAVSDDYFIQTSLIQNGDVISVENNCFTSCKDTITSTSAPFIVDSVNIAISADTTINSGQQAILTCYTPVDSISWTPSYLVQHPDSVQTIAYPDQTTTFFAEAYINGCKVSKSTTVFIKDKLTIYNTFSPNGDDINDRWIIPGIEKYPDAEVSVFTRWGQRIYFGIGYKTSNAWDGKINGRWAEPGTYFYVIDLNTGDNKDVIKGSLNIIR